MSAMDAMDAMISLGSRSGWRRGVVRGCRGVRRAAFLAKVGQGRQGRQGRHSFGLRGSLVLEACGLRVVVLSPGYGGEGSSSLSGRALTVGGDVLRVRRRSWELAAVALVVGLTGCAPSPCPDGVHEGSIVMENDEYFVSRGALGGSYSLGKLGEAGIENCREIRGNLVFGDNITSFGDFDNLEILWGTMTHPGTNHPTDVIDGREWKVTDGFGALRHVGGSILGNGVMRGMSQLESVGGNLDVHGTSFFALREIGGDMVSASTHFDFRAFGNLEAVGRDLVTTAGNFHNLVRLKVVGRDIRVAYSDEVNFVLPELESVGRDVIVTINDSIADVDVPSLRTIGRDLRFDGNSFQNLKLGATGRAQRAFAGVEVGGITRICRNEPDDPCPDEPECWDVYDESYCCPPDTPFNECLSNG